MDLIENEEPIFQAKAQRRAAIFAVVSGLADLFNRETRQGRGVELALGVVASIIRAVGSFMAVQTAREKAEAQNRHGPISELASRP